MLNFMKLFAWVIVLSLFSMPAKASVVTFNFDTLYSGSSPRETGPWGSLSFEDVAGGVLLTISTTDLGSSEFISDIYFNYNPAKSLSKLKIQYIDGVRPLGYAAKKDSEKAGPVHTFDIDIVYPTAHSRNRLNDDSTTQLLISSVAGLQADDFDYYTERDGNSYYAAAHLQAICGTRSAWIAADPPIAVAPEPASMFLMGIGLVSAVAMKRRESRRSA